MTTLMYHQDEFLERIRQTEINKLNKLSVTKLFSNMHIESTREFESTKKIKQDLIEKKFKHDSTSKYWLLIFTVFISSKTIGDTFFKTNTDTSFLVLEYIVSVAFIFGTIIHFFFKKPSDYNILIDKTKIEVEKKTFLWKDIYDTAILTKGGGKTERHFFIIAMKDMSTYEIFELDNFTQYWNFCDTLSRYIEYFKPATRQ